MSKDPEEDGYLGELKCVRKGIGRSSWWTWPQLFTGIKHLVQASGVVDVGSFVHLAPQTHCAPPSSAPDAVPRSSSARAHRSIMGTRHM